MITRNTQYVSLRRYGTAFLDAFGFYPIDYFGCIGDNMTDNYANLQVAVNESVKKGYRYIFVPNGSYYYTGNLVDANKLVWLGDAEHAKVWNNSGEITIYQIGTQVPYVKGTKTLEKTVTEDGYIDIEVPVKNGSETILVIGSSVIYVTDTLILLNGSLIGDSKVYLDELDGVYITDIAIVKNAIRISYTGTGTINKEVEWRVR